jgi:hypothetical protein
LSIIQSAPLILGHNSEIVEAEIVALSSKNIEDYELLWQALLREFVAEDKYWSWALKERLVQNSSRHEGYAIEYEGLTQGLTPARV